MRVAWRVQKISLDLASVRYRALLPFVSLSAAGVAGTLTAKAEKQAIAEATHLVVVKAFTDADIELVRQARRDGKRVLFDLCDNIFVEGYGKGSVLTPAQALHAMAGDLSGVVVPTPTLAEIVRQHLGTPAVSVIPDGLEDPAVLAKERAVVLRYTSCVSKNSLFADLRAAVGSWIRKRGPRHGALAMPTETKLIVWFGNHGSPWSSFGLADILLYRAALEQIAEEFDALLVVVSNNRERFEAEIKPLRIPSLYVDWTPDVLHQVLAQADVMIAPNSLDAFSLCKSSNRTVMALAAGVPVVATPTPALEQLRECIWLDDPLVGLRSYLFDPKLAKSHVKAARDVVKTSFSSPVIGRLWEEALAGRSR